jgi:hypothetical protein
MSAWHFKQQPPRQTLNNLLLLRLLLLLLLPTCKGGCATCESSSHFQTEYNQIPKSQYVASTRILCTEALVTRPVENQNASRIPQVHEIELGVCPGGQSLALHIVLAFIHILFYSAILMQGAATI